jgi:hypothetical protein
VAGCFACGDEHPGSMKCGGFLGCLRNCYVSQGVLLNGVNLLVR